jgi:hypothetical protein
VAQDSGFVPGSCEHCNELQSLMGCTAVFSSRCRQTFQRCVPPPSSGLIHHLVILLELYSTFTPWLVDVPFAHLCMTFSECPWFYSLLDITLRLKFGLQFIRRRFLSNQDYIVSNERMITE